VKAGEVGWERGEEACLVSTAVSCVAEPVSSICTFIRGEKSPGFSKAWEEGYGEKSVTGVNPLMCILIPQFMFLLYFFAGKAGSHLPHGWLLPEDHTIRLYLQAL